MYFQLTYCYGRFDYCAVSRSFTMCEEMINLLKKIVSRKLLIQNVCDGDLVILIGERSVFKFKGSSLQKKNLLLIFRRSSFQNLKENLLLRFRGSSFQNLKKNMLLRLRGSSFQSSRMMGNGCNVRKMRS